MKKIQDDIIKLIKSSLTGKPEAISEDIDIGEVLNIAVKHGIYAIIYYGALNCGIDGECSEMQALFAYTCKCIARNAHQEYEISALLKEFDKNGAEN